MNEHNTVPASSRLGTEVAFRFAMDPFSKLGPEEAWPLMQRLLTRFSEAATRATFVDECLDELVELLSADRGLVAFFGEDGEVYAINARAAGRTLAAREREEISRTALFQVRDRGEAFLYEADRAEASSSMGALGIQAAIAVPIQSRRDPASGAVYLDFRDARRAIGPIHREVVEAAAALIASVLDQSVALEEARDEIEELRALGATEPPSLEELLRPSGFEELADEIRSLAAGDSTLLIVGESGTGKTLLGTAIARASGRLPVVRVTLGAADDLNTITSELFGHERGAYSGAVHKRVGLVEQADGGTLILDEILNLPLHTQQLLLDFTQFGTYRPLGHALAEPKRARVRLIAVTNGDVERAVAEGRFREDLYYRLAGGTLELPPLRERREDVPGMAEGFLRRLDPERDWSLSLELRRTLVSEAVAWRGNVRQLEAVIRRARERALYRDPESKQLDIIDVRPRELGTDARAAFVRTAQKSEAPSLAMRFAALSAERETIDSRERELLREALEAEGGVVARVARSLGMPRTTLVSRIRALGLREG